MEQRESTDRIYALSDETAIMRLATSSRGRCVWQPVVRSSAMMQWPPGFSGRSIASSYAIQVKGGGRVNMNFFLPNDRGGRLVWFPGDI